MYFAQGEEAMLSDLLKDNFEMDVIGDPELKAVVGLEDISKVNGRFILGKINILGNNYEITSNIDAKRIAV